MHGIIEHPHHRTGISGVYCLEKSICHVGTIHEIINKHLRIIHRSIRLCRCPTKVFTLINRIGRFHKLKSDLTHHDFPTCRNSWFVGTDNVSILPAVHRYFGRIGMDIIKTNLIFQMRSTTIHPPGLISRPDCSIRPHNRKFTCKFVLLQFSIEEADGTCPKGVFSVR